MSPPIVPVILSGGSGTRLWPLSRPMSPKQLLRLVTSRTLLQDTVLRARGLMAAVGDPVVICNERQRFLVAEQLRELGVGVGTIVLEPVARNTAPAVAVAAMLAARDAALGEDALLLVMPADHVIADTDAFGSAVDVALAAAREGSLVTFGVVPTRPETGYGYIRRGTARPEGWAAIEQFVEKPAPEAAAAYLKSGQYLWNSGMFLFPARMYLAELARFAPRMVSACRAALDDAVRDADFLRLGEAFLGSAAASVDYAVMEQTDRAAVVPLDAGWSDIGSWPALHEVLAKDDNGNVVRGDVIAEACRDSYVLASGRLVVALGLEGHVVVETDDAVLVMARDQAQRLKSVVENQLGVGPRKRARSAAEGT